MSVNKRFSPLVGERLERLLVGNPTLPFAKSISGTRSQNHYTQHVLARGKRRLHLRVPRADETPVPEAVPHLARELNVVEDVIELGSVR